MYGLGQIVPPKMENQMEKRVENEDGIWGLAATSTNKTMWNRVKVLASGSM